jgi:putative OPT family oligopeptide transporter
MSEDSQQGAPEVFDRSVSGEEYKPYVPASKSIAEFSLKAGLAGVILGIIFAMANAYIGLRAGVTVCASIPVAVMSVAIFSLMHRLGLSKRPTVLETNMSQTIGSAGEALAGGIIFTIPALIIWGYSPDVFQMFVFGAIGGLLGTLSMIPLRRLLVKKEHRNLPYPEGTACAEVIVAADAGGAHADSVFKGLGVGALFFLVFRALRWSEEVASFPLTFLKKAQISIGLSPAYLGVGYILGYRISAIMVGGGLLAWLVIIPLIATFGEGMREPLFPATTTISSMGAEKIWHYYIRYIGAGAVAFGGIITMLRATPLIFQSVKSAAKQATERGGGAAHLFERTDRDINLRYILGGVAVLAVIIALVHTIPVGILGAALIVVFSFFFVTVSSRICGIVGSSSNPISGMTIATLLGCSLLFVALGQTGAGAKVAVLSIGAVVCMASAVAGDMSQDLKTGFLVGATPSKQQIGEMLGVLTSAAFIGATVMLLHKAYVIGSESMPAPQATLMSMVVSGVLDGNLPWGLVLTGVVIAISFELLAIPSLPLAVGLYLPLSTTAPIFVGGLIRAGVERRKKATREKSRFDRGILFASGMIGGEGLVGVILALIISSFVSVKAGLTQAYEGFSAAVGGWGVPHLLDIAGICVLALLCFILYASARKRAAD